MDCLDFFDLLDKYESLTEKEISDLDNHAAECEICQYEYEFFKSIIKTSAALPCPEPPKDLIAKVNEQLDKTPVVTSKANIFINNIKRNAYKYATAAACLAVGLVVGLNNSTIKENLENKKTDGVISTTTTVTDTASKKPVEKPSEIAVPVEEATTAPVPTENKKDRKSEHSVVTTKRENTAKPTATQKPLAVNTAAPATAKPTQTQESIVTPIPEVVKEEKTIATETPVQATVSPNNSGKKNTYTIARGVYHIPATEITEATEAPVNETEEMQEYALASDSCQIAIGYYDVPENDKKKNTAQDFTEQLIVNVKDVGTITRYMSTLGAMNHGKGYQMSLSNFYELLMILDEDEISYRYSSGVHTGDTIVFSIVSY